MKRAPLWLVFGGLVLGSVGFVGLGGWAFTSSLARPAVSVLEAEEASVTAWIRGQLTDEGGTLIVQTVAPAGLVIELPELEVDGLTFTAEGAVRVETVGDRQVHTQEFRFSGASGMYEVGPLTAYWLDREDEPQRADSEVFWVDLGVDPPRDGELVDIAEPAAVWSIPWGILAGLAGLAGVVLGGLFLAFRSVPTRASTERLVPAHVLALQEWKRVRADEALDDHAKSIELSRIFREYTETVLGFPATAWTSRQTLDHLRQLTHLPEGNVPRAKRLLRATDLVKYADHDPEADFFEDLDSDLRAFVDATRPAGGPS